MIICCCSFRSLDFRKNRLSRAGVGAALFEVLMTHFNQQGLAGHLASLHDFTPSQQLIAVDRNSAIAIDESRAKICLVKNGTTDIDCRFITYGDVLSVIKRADRENRR